MRLISECWFFTSFYLIFLSNGSEGKEDWPYCKNFASAKGYPTGKDYIVKTCNLQTKPSLDNLETYLKT